jgi:chorismate synthase
MAGSSFGTIFRLSSFGESHGIAIGGVIDGVPGGFDIDVNAIQQELNRRRPGQSAIVTQRKELDELVILSGIFEGKTTGAPIGFHVLNKDQQPKDYDKIAGVFRPSHADFTYAQKYGHRDYRGGGRSSARETIARVVAGAIAKQILAHERITIDAFVDQVGSLKWTGEWTNALRTIKEANAVRVPSIEMAEQMEALIQSVRKDGDTIGGCVRCVINNVPVGLGEPVFHKLNAELGKAMLSINAVKGFSIGSGFESMAMLGSEHNDQFLADGTTATNYSGGIQGGISNGMPIDFRVAFKPVATILKEQATIDKDYNAVQLTMEGRHDPCVVPRAVVIVESMAAMVILDFLMLDKAKMLH